MNGIIIRNKYHMVFILFYGFLINTLSVWLMNAITLAVQIMNIIKTYKKNYEVKNDER